MFPDSDRRISNRSRRFSRRFFLEAGTAALTIAAFESFKPRIVLATQQEINKPLISPAEEISGFLWIWPSSQQTDIYQLSNNEGTGRPILIPVFPADTRFRLVFKVPISSDELYVLTTTAQGRKLDTVLTNGRDLTAEMTEDELKKETARQKIDRMNSVDYRYADGDWPREIISASIYATKLPRDQFPEFDPEDPQAANKIISASFKIA